MNTGITDKPSSLQDAMRRIDADDAPSKPYKPFAEQTKVKPHATAQTVPSTQGSVVGNSKHIGYGSTSSVQRLEELNIRTHDISQSIANIDEYIGNLLRERKLLLTELADTHVTILAVQINMP